MRGEFRSSARDGQAPSYTIGRGVKQRFGIKIPIDTGEGKAALSSAIALADFILQAQGK